AAPAKLKASPPKKYRGQHALPTGVTLLAMRNADGSETLGARLGDDTVLDVRRAAQLLRMTAPLTLAELLREGNARGLNELIHAAATSRRCHAPRCKGVVVHLRQGVQKSGQDRLHRTQLPGQRRGNQPQAHQRSDPF